MEDQWYVIADLKEFTDKARSIVYNNFGSWNNSDNIDILIDDVAENEREEFEKALSHQESLVIVKELVKKQKNRKTNKIRFIVNDTLFADLIYKLNDRMVSNIVSNLVQKGLIESAFDNDTNDFVFWIKEQPEEEKPETD